MPNYWQHICNFINKLNVNMSKINSIIVFFLIISINLANAQTIDATKFCEQINSILVTWKTSNLTQCQGAIIGVNETLKTTKYKNNKLVDGAIKNEVLCYKDAPNLNSVSIIFYESEVFDAYSSNKFKTIFTLLKNCLKSYTVEQNAGTTTGLKDEDGDLPDFDFIKAGAPSVNISIEEPLMDKTFKVIITIEEPADE
jgi:hypothetical protein